MKKLLFLLSFFVWFSAFSQVKIGTSGDIVPIGSYPAVKIGNYQTGSYPVQTLVQRNGIPSYMRIPFMSVYVGDSVKSYRLGSDLSTWTEILTLDATKLPLAGGTVTGTIAVNPSSGSAVSKTGLTSGADFPFISATTSDAARAPMGLRFSNTVINGETDPITSIGYGANTNGTEIKAGERGLAIHIEGNYNDGSGQNKMELYPQYVSGAGVYKRPLFIQMNKATDKVSSFFMTGDLIKMFADSSTAGPGTEIPSYTFSRNSFLIHPVFNNQSTKISLQAASGQASVVSQGYNGIDDGWLQYHDGTDQFGMFLNSRRVATWYSKLSGAGTAGSGLSIGTQSNQAIFTAATGTSHTSLRTIVAQLGVGQTGNAFEVQNSSAAALFTITPTGSIGRILNIDTAATIGANYTNATLTLGTGGGGTTSKKSVIFAAGGYGEPGGLNVASNGDKIIFSRDGSYDASMGDGTGGNLWIKSTGKLEYYLGSSAALKFTFNSNGSMVMAGTSGGGFIGMPLQLTAPATPAGNGINIYSNVNNAFAYKSAATGFEAAFDATGNTADRNYAFPDISGTALVGSTVNTVSPTSPNRTITIKIGATTYYIAAKTTND